MVIIAREQIFSRQDALFGEVPTILQMFSEGSERKKEKACAAGDSDNRRTEHTPRKCSRCGSEDHIIAKFPKPHKENEK